MTADCNLGFHEASRRFVVEVVAGGHKVSFRDEDERDDCDSHPIYAIYYDGHGWSYYVGETYNCGYSSIELDTDRLGELMRFCDMLEQMHVL